MSRNINIQAEFELSPQSLESLVLLYQPVFSFNALNLYLTLYELGKLSLETSEKELVQILKSPSDELLIQRQELEQMNLLNTYRKDKDTYVLKEPLSPQMFLQHAMFGRLYSIVCGQEAFKRNVLRYVRHTKTIEGEDISKRFDPNRLAIWDEKLEAAFSKQDAPAQKPMTLSSQAAQSEPLLKNRFDVELYFEGIPNIVYPIEFRTPQLKKLIEEVGTLFDVDFETMKRFMINSSNFENKRFDTKKFVYLLEKEFGRMKVNKENPYDVDPVSFIRHKQGYEYVVGSDQNLVKSLTENFGFNHQVVNFLVEYVLEINSNNLNRAYVEKIASTWKRNGVTTLEDARKQVEVKPKAKTQSIKTTQTMPEYTKEEVLSDSEQDELRLSIQKMLQTEDE